MSAAEFAGSDPIDAQSAEVHRRARVLLAEAGVPESEENYLASVEVIVALNDGRGLNAAAKPTELDHRIAFGDAVSRIAVDRLGSDYDADQYAEMLMTVERELRPTLNDYDDR